MTPPIRAILAATDLGSASDAVVRSAGILARAAGAELHLLHSLELRRAPAEGPPRQTGFFEQVEAARERLREQAERTLPPDVRPASEEVVVHLAHKAIGERAEAVGAGMIVVGPHRGGAAGAHFLGTTADRVIRTAHVPCLVVRDPLPERIREIGVPTDCSDPSPGALETALAWALRMGGTPPVVRVMYVGWPVERHDDPHLEERTLRPELEELARRAAAAVEGAGALDVRIEVRWSNQPAEEIVQWAAAGAVDLLVMGTHGRSGLRRALMGSVGSGVARRTPRPVLLVPPSLWHGEAGAPHPGG